MDQKLFDIVLRAIKHEGAKSAADTIQLAHMGKPMGFINNDNLHLFRVYRNYISNDASHLINQVLRKSLDKQAQV